MKKFKNEFGVRGSIPLLKAFKEEVEQLGWKYDENFTPWEKVERGEYDLYFNNSVGVGSLRKNHFSLSKATSPLYLPQDWNKALQLASEVEEEEFKVGDIVVALKDTETQEDFNIDKGTISEITDFSKDGKLWLKCIPIGKGVANPEDFRKATPDEIAGYKQSTIKIAGYKAEVKDNKIAFGCKKFSREDLQAIKRVIKVARTTELDFTFCDDRLVTIGYEGKDYPIFADDIDKLINKL